MTSHSSAPAITAASIYERLSFGVSVNELARAFRRAFDRRARAFGYTQSQWRVLLALGKCEGTNQVALADRLEMQPIALARILDRMETAGLVERKRDPDDRRAVKLSLTAAAEPIMKVLREIAEDVRGQASLGVPEEQQAEITAVLQRMRTNLEKSDGAQQSQVG